jgi:hypothetical protein
MLSLRLSAGPSNTKNTLTLRPTGRALFVAPA